MKDDQNDRKDQMNKSISKKTDKKVSFNQMIRIDKEGQIVSADEDELQASVKKVEKSSNESSDDEDEPKSSKKHPEKEKKIRDHIMNKYKRKRGIHRELSITGSESKSNKSGGDMKKQGRPDPYAYVPIDRSLLSKRKALKNKTKFQNIVKSALNGGKKGSKRSFKRK